MHFDILDQFRDSLKKEFKELLGNQSGLFEIEPIHYSKPLLNTKLCLSEENAAAAVNVETGTFTDLETSDYANTAIKAAWNLQHMLQDSEFPPSKNLRQAVSKTIACWDSSNYLPQIVDEKTYRLGLLMQKMLINLLSSGWTTKVGLVLKTLNAWDATKVNQMRHGLDELNKQLAQYQSQTAEADTYIEKQMQKIEPENLKVALDRIEEKVAALKKGETVGIEDIRSCLKAIKHIQTSRALKRLNYLLACKENELEVLLRHKGISEKFYIYKPRYLQKEGDVAKAIEQESYWLSEPDLVSKEVLFIPESKSLDLLRQRCREYIVKINNHDQAKSILNTALDASLHKKTKMNPVIPPPVPQRETQAEGWVSKGVSVLSQAYTYCLSFFAPPVTSTISHEVVVKKQIAHDIRLVNKYIRHVDGEFWKYLRERASKYAIRDSLSSLFCFFGQTEKQKREGYVRKLMGLLRSYAAIDYTKPQQIHKLEGTIFNAIEEGLQRFTPRASTQKSLRTYLLALKKDVMVRTSVRQQILKTTAASSGQSPEPKPLFRRVNY